MSRYTIEDPLTCITYANVPGHDLVLPTQADLVGFFGEEILTEGKKDFRTTESEGREC